MHCVAWRSSYPSWHFCTWWYKETLPAKIKCWRMFLIVPKLSLIPYMSSPYVCLKPPGEAERQSAWTLPCETSVTTLASPSIFRITNSHPTAIPPFFHPPITPTQGKQIWVLNSSGYKKVNQGRFSRPVANRKGQGKLDRSKEMAHCSLCKLAGSASHRQ